MYFLWWYIYLLGIYLGAGVYITGPNVIKRIAFYVCHMGLSSYICNIVAGTRCDMQTGGEFASIYAGLLMHTCTQNPKAWSFWYRLWLITCLKQSLLTALNIDDILHHWGQVRHMYISLRKVINVLDNTLVPINGVWLIPMHYLNQSWFTWNLTPLEKSVTFESICKKSHSQKSI